MNRRVCESLKKHGDDLNNQRKIEHLVRLPSAEVRSDFVHWVQIAGFSIDSASDEADEYGQFSVVFSRPDRPVQIDEITLPLFENAAELGGECDARLSGNALIDVRSRPSLASATAKRPDWDTFRTKHPARRNLHRPTELRVGSNLYLGLALAIPPRLGGRGNSSCHKLLAVSDAFARTVSSYPFAWSSTHSMNRRAARERARPGGCTR